MKNISLQQLTFCGILAAVYAALTVATAAFAYGGVQFRLAEALCVLPFFAPWTSYGLVLGCLIANLFSTVSALDIVIGTCATLIGCLLTTRVRHKWLVPLPTVLSNSVLVGAMLALVYTPDAPLQGFALFALQVGAGELAVLYALGMPLLLVMQRKGLDARLNAL